jgi:hypothetical protein
MRTRLLAALTAALLVLGAAACAPDETQEETGEPPMGQDTGEGAPPEGGIGEEPAEEEGPTSDEDPIDG